MFAVAAMALTACENLNPDPEPEPGDVPVITIISQPTAPEEGLTVGSIPDDTRLTVVASVTEGATLSYQWYTYDPELNEVFEAISGATDASYTLPTDLVAGDHYYVCEVSAPEAESKRTDPVAVRVAEEVIFGLPRLPQGALDEYVELYAEVVEAYLDIDDNYSTLLERQTLSPSSRILYDFWARAYLLINYSETVIRGGGGETEVEIKQWKARGELYRAKAYIYLTTLFGGVPVPNYDDPMASPGRSTVSEVYSNIIYNLDVSMGGLPQDEVAQSLFANLLVMVSRKDYVIARDFANILSSSGALVLSDINRDGIFNSNDRNEANLLAVQARLLGAEACLALNDLPKATQFLTGLADIPPSATADEILSTVKDIWSQWNEGMKFMNRSRRGETDSWGKYALMPIPEQEMIMGGIEQNPGW